VTSVGVARMGQKWIRGSRGETGGSSLRGGVWFEEGGLSVGEEFIFDAPVVEEFVWVERFRGKVDLGAG
jgi:hypothetical protein